MFQNTNSVVADKVATADLRHLGVSDKWGWHRLEGGVAQQQEASQFWPSIVVTGADT